MIASGILTVFFTEKPVRGAGLLLYLLSVFLFTCLCAFLPLLLLLLMMMMLIMSHIIYLCSEMSSPPVCCS